MKTGTRETGKRFFLKKTCCTDTHTHTHTHSHTHTQHTHTHKKNEMNSAVTIDDIRAAHARIRPFVRRTEIMTSAGLTQLGGLDQLFFKCENFQRTGAFKVRGATNAVLMHCKQNQQQNNPVFVTHSSGNHGAALAFACRAAGGGARALVVCPNDAPQSKIDGMRVL